MTARPEHISQILATLPDAPGVYEMLDDTGRRLYIGKAISLRSRVRSYFQERADLSPRIAAMVARVADIRTTMVDNEVEALILEANHIQRYQPPYNVRLRDGKRYPYIKITNESFPRVLMTRSILDDGARYYGPYTDAHGVRALLDLLRRVFPLRTCLEEIDGKRARPCLQFHIKRCLAPCTGAQSESEYRAIIDEVALFFEGRQDRLLTRMQQEMALAADELRYEAAARLRDRIVAVRQLTQSQRVVWRSTVEMDAIALARSQGQACAQLFRVREGKLIGQEHAILDGAHEQDDAVLLADFLAQFYTTAASVPKELLLSVMPEESEVLTTWLSQVKGARVRIVVPRRGDRLAFLKTVGENAAQSLTRFLHHQEVQESASAQSLVELAAALGLPAPPRRIECYDISNIQGTNAVASMVVFIDGRSRRSAYRRFRMQYDRGANDFAMMAETLRRRLRYLRPESDGVPRAKAERFSEMPDLLLIDGGKGQLHAVVAVRDELDLRGIPVAGLAKEHEWLFIPGRAEPIILPPQSAGLHLVMRIRDEAHRFAVTYHRGVRSKAMTASLLDRVEGIGPTLRRRLLDTFGSVRALQRASLDEIAAVKGMTSSLTGRLAEVLRSEESASPGADDPTSLGEFGPRRAEEEAP